MNSKIMGLAVFLMGLIAYYFLFVEVEVESASKTTIIQKQNVEDKLLLEQKKLSALKTQEEKVRTDLLKAESEEKTRIQEIEAEKKAKAELLKAQEILKRQEEERKTLLIKSAQEKEMSKVKQDTYSMVYDKNGLNVYMDDYIIGEISKEKLDYVVKRVALNIDNATVTIKRDKNDKAYMEITKYTKELNVDSGDNLAQINFSKNKHTYNFAYDKSNLPDNQKIKEFFTDLDYAIQETDVKKIVIVGHTDSKGDDNYNLFLSYRRANALKDRLSKYDIDTNYVAKGESEPIASNKTQEGRAENRRIEIRLYGEYSK